MTANVQTAMHKNTHKSYLICDYSLPILVTSSYIAEHPTLELNVFYGRASRPPLFNQIQDFVDIHHICEYLKMSLSTVQQKYKSIVLLDEPSLKWANAVVYILLRMTKTCQDAENYMRSLIQPVWSHPNELELLLFLRYSSPENFQLTIKPSVDNKTFVKLRSLPLTNTLAPFFPRLERKSVIGTISQFSFPCCKTSDYACGSISIYALIYSKWRHPAFWTYRDIDSLILHGLQKAGRYLSRPEQGVENTEEQLNSMAYELKLKAIDIMYHYNLGEPHRLVEALRVIEQRSTPTWLLFTTISLGAKVGHHMFMYHEGGIWYWLESLRCSEITLRNSHTNLGGAALRVFEGFQALCNFAELEIVHKKWSLIEVVESENLLTSRSYEVPRCIVNIQPISLAVKFDNPIVIEQHPMTHEWRIISQIKDNRVIPFPNPYIHPFDIVLKPKQSLIAQYDIPVNSIIFLNKLSSAKSSNAIQINPLSSINQSPFEDPMIIVNSNGYPCMVGDQGCRIAHYMRKSMCSYNVRLMFGEDNDAIYLSFTESVPKGSEIILIKY